MIKGLFMHGFTGKLLKVNLTTGSISREKLDLKYATKFLGGRGLAAKILFDQLKPRTDPLSPENRLIFMTTPMNGTPAPSFVKYTVETKSPLSGSILMTLAGGYFAAELKFAGYDALIIEGKAKTPSYVRIRNSSVTIREAQHLWGMLTDDTQRYLLQENGESEVCCIGPAGERLVKYACIISGVRAHGRGGAGAVMGSKNLKAVVVKGSGKVGVVNREKFNSAVGRILQSYKESERLKRFAKYSTPGVINHVNERGILPTKNFQAGVFDPTLTTINAEYHQKLVVKKYTCYKCPVACGNLTLVRDGPYAGYLTAGPDYESIWAFGPQCGNSCFEAIVAADRLCDNYGIDVISTGNCIGFAMECYERGVVDKQTADGLDLRFGNHREMVELVKKIAYKDGFGGLLAEGVRETARRLGSVTERYAMHVKGLEMSGYDPRGAKGMGLEYATSPRGGCHERGLVTQETFGRPTPVDRLTVKGKAELVKKVQVEMAVLDSLGFCVFPAHNAHVEMECLADLYTATTGIELTSEELLKAGERILNLERLFNVREGLTRKDDTLPEKLLKEPMPEGPSKGHVVELQTMLHEYYRVMDWDEDGVPREDKRAELEF